MELPLILINFKTYEKGTGKEAFKLAKICKKVSDRFGVTIGVCPQYTDIYRIASKIDIPVFAQHIDPVEYGSHTGHTLAEAVKEAGAVGTLINHSEKPMLLKDIEECIKIAKKVGLIAVCCVPDISMAKKIAKLSPNFMAYEVPELIGTGRAISKEKPDSVKKFVEALHSINPDVIPLCGAGISTGEDVKIAIELGTKGVLLLMLSLKLVIQKKY